jgi:Flp pilus assembly protein CpaB
MSSLNTGSGKSLFDGRKMWFFFAAIAAIVSAGVIFSVLSAVSATSSYWMIKDGTTVSARTAITPDMLTEVTVPRESAPKNTVTFSQLKAAISTPGTEDDYYALYSLQAGDIITTSNVSTLSGFSSSSGMPAGTVLASFKASPSNAAGGVVKQGSLIDIAIVYQVGTEFYSQYILSHVPVIKATGDLDGSSGANGATVSSAAGAPVLYTVAVTPEQAAALAIANKYSIYVVLTSANIKDVAGTGTSLSDALNGVEGVPTNATIPDSNTSVIPQPTPSPSPSN